MPQGFSNTTFLSPDATAAATEFKEWIHDDIKIIFLVFGWTTETQELTKWADKMSGPLTPFERHVVVAPAFSKVQAVVNALAPGNGITLPLPANAIAVTISPVSNEVRAILVTGQNTPVDAFRAFVLAEVAP